MQSLIFQYLQVRLVQLEPLALPDLPEQPVPLGLLEQLE